jgi:hypothetical protein
MDAGGTKLAARSPSLDKDAGDVVADNAGAGSAETGALVVGSVVCAQIGAAAMSGSAARISPEKTQLTKRFLVGDTVIGDRQCRGMGGRHHISFGQPDRSGGDNKDGHEGGEGNQAVHIGS